MPEAHWQCLKGLRKSPNQTYTDCLQFLAKSKGGEICFFCHTPAHLVADCELWASMKSINEETIDSMHMWRCCALPCCVVINYGCPTHLIPNFYPVVTRNNLHLSAYFFGSTEVNKLKLCNFLLPATQDIAIYYTTWWAQQQKCGDSQVPL